MPLAASTNSDSSGAGDVGDTAGATGVFQLSPLRLHQVPLVLGPFAPIVRRYPLAVPTWDSPDSDRSSRSPPGPSSSATSSAGPRSLASPRSPLPLPAVPIPAQIGLDHHILAYSAFAASTGLSAFPVSRSSVHAYLRHAALLPSWSSRDAPGLRRICRLQDLPWLSIGAARALSELTAPSPPPHPPPAPPSRSWTSYPDPWVELTILDYDRDTASVSRDLRKYLRNANDFQRQ